MRRRRPNLVMGTLALGALLLLGACEDRGPQEVRVPEDLRGRWVTDDPDYADRAFEITDAELIFHQGDGLSTTDSIHALEIGSVTKSSDVLYEFYYPRGAEDLYRFAVRYDPASRLVVLHNQPEVVWRKAGAGGG